MKIIKVACCLLLLKRLMNRTALEQTCRYLVLQACHAHGLNARDQNARTRPRLESQHGPDYSFCSPIVLLNQVEQVFDLAQFDRFGCRDLYLQDGSLVGGTAVNADLLRNTEQSNSVLTALEHCAQCGIHAGGGGWQR